METQNFFFVPHSWQDKKHFFVYFFIELKTYYVSNSIYIYLFLFIYL